MRFPLDNPDVIHGIVRLEKPDTPFILDFEDEFVRLEGIGQLGLVGDVVRSAKYSKLEHTFGAYHLVVQGGESIPVVKGKEAKAKLTAMRRAMLAHSFGRLPLTYAMDAALAEAAEHSTGVRRQVVSWVNKVRKFIKCDDCNRRSNYHYVCHEPRRLHNWIAAWKILRRANTTEDWQKRWELDSDGLRDLVAMLACRHHPMSGILMRIDAFDYVPRDFHYAALGTIEINFDAALGGLGSVEAPEARFLSLTEEYLSERLYGHHQVALLERLVSKLAAALLIKKRIRPTQLLRMDDSALRRELNRKSGDGLPTLDDLVGQVIGERWFCVNETHELPRTAVDDVDSAIGDQLTHPFSDGVILVAHRAGRNQVASRLYARKDLPDVTPALARLLSTVASASTEALATEEVKAWVRPLALSICGAVFSPAEKIAIHADRLSPTVRRAFAVAIEAAGTTPQQVIDETIERYSSENPLQDDLSLEIAGRPFFRAHNQHVSGMLGSRLASSLGDANHPPADAAITLVVRALLEDPGLFPDGLIDGVAAALQKIRDEAAEETERAIAAELREYLLEHKDAAELDWAFPPCEIIAPDGAVKRELDGLVLTVSMDGILRVRVLEITTSASAEKATADIAKAGKLLTAARKRGAQAELMRIGPKEIARFRQLR